MNIDSKIMTKPIIDYVCYKFLYSKLTISRFENILNEEIKSSRISIKVSFILTMKVFKINRC